MGARKNKQTHTRRQRWNTKLSSEVDRTTKFRRSLQDAEILVSSRPDGSPPTRAPLGERGLRGEKLLLLRHAYPSAHGQRENCLALTHPYARQVNRKTNQCY